MKIPLIFVLIGMIVMITVPAGAASVGDPETQGQGKIGTTAEWSYIFNRDLDFKKAKRPPGYDSYMPENFKVVRGDDLMAKISYGLLDAMDVYIKLGTANYGLKGDVFLGDTKRVTENLLTGDSFIYGGGLKLNYQLNHGWIVGCDAQYLTQDHELDFRAVNLVSGAVSTAKYYDCWIQEWHAAPYVAKKIKDFTLYVGGRYSDLLLIQKNPNDPRRWDNLIFHAHYNIGVFTGIDWNFGNSFKLNVEGRFVDETAMSVCGTYRF